MAPRAGAAWGAPPLRLRAALGRDQRSVFTFLKNEYIYRRFKLQLAPACGGAAPVERDLPRRARIMQYNSAPASGRGVAERPSDRGPMWVYGTVGAVAWQLSVAMASSQTGAHLHLYVDPSSGSDDAAGAEHSQVS
eukprot:SAG31_NODE_1200_length_9419_cov_15.101717_3_plen_136_part_00